MYSEKTEIVDVVAVDNGYSLSKKAGDLFEAAKAGTVIRRHDVNETGNPDYKDYAYVGLSEVKLNGSGYSFKFASGDEFTASDADAYPSASSISDAIAGGSSDEPLINEVEETVYTGVLGEYENVIKAIYACKLNDDWTAVMSTLTESELDSAVVYVDGVADEYNLTDTGHLIGTLETDVGKPVEIKVTRAKTSPALINLYDPDSENTGTYYPDGSYEYDSDEDEYVITLDVSAAYERLKRGQNVWIRWYFNDAVHTDLVCSYYEEDDVLWLEMGGGGAFSFTNYTGESESDGE